MKPHEKAALDDAVKGENVRTLLLEPVLGKPVSIGELDGLVKIPDDFDEPLEEMKEYMF
jgi:hypothetical protein